MLGRATRWLDVSLLLVLAAMGLQVIPLPLDLLARIAPGTIAFKRIMTVAPIQSRSQSISVDPQATTTALLLVGALMLAFWATRTALGCGGLRWLSRWIAMIGLVVAVVGIAQHLTMVPILDLIWPVTRRDLRPWGPFVNRNDYSGWLLLAVMVTLGYLVARLQARHQHGEPFDPERAFDDTGTRLAVALCLMTAGIMVSLSRSGLLGLAIGMITFLLIIQRDVSARRLRRLAIALLVLVGIAGLFANFGLLSARLEAIGSEGLGSRLAEWRQIIPMALDFWPVGAGVGSFGRVMPFYQTSTVLITISHADNELLQTIAEGGALVGIPVALVLVTGIALVWKRLRDDRSAMFAIRAGAASGLVAIAVQNMFEMTLRVPATGLLFATLAAIAMHVRPSSGTNGGHRHRAAATH